MWKNEITQFLPFLITLAILIVGWRVRLMWVVWIVPILSVGFVALWWWESYSEVQILLGAVYGAAPEDVIR
jgi:hypothetical protein